MAAMISYSQAVAINMQNPVSLIPPREISCRSPVSKLKPLLFHRFPFLKNSKSGLRRMGAHVSNRITVASHDQFTKEQPADGWDGGGGAAGGLVISNDSDALIQTPGMGAVLDDKGGCIFRVWSPHAEAADVVVWSAETAPRKFPMVKGGAYWAQRIPGVRAGDRYHFVFRHGGDDFVRRDAHARQTDFGSDTCFVVDSKFDWAPFEAVSWDRLNIYQLQVHAFTAREGGGTFAALEAKLDYIKSLNFNAIQLLPVHEFSGQWGYNPRLLLAIHSPYGTPEDLRRLVNEAHRRGIAVIFDVVLNHGAAKLNSLWAYDGWNPANKGGIYFDGGRDTAWGKSFAFWQREVEEMLIEAASMFLSEYNGDGLRFDSVHSMPWDLCKKITWTLHERFPQKILISEMTPETSKVISGAGFDCTWIHASFFDTRKFTDGERDLRHVERVMGLPHGFKQGTECLKYLLGCHDQIGCRKNGAYDNDINGYHRYSVDRFGGRKKWEARAMARMWYGVQCASVGIPMLFMGTEIHQEGWWGINPDHCFNWNFVDDSQGREMVALVRAANELRDRNPALRSNRIETLHFDAEGGILAVRRQSEKQDLVVVVNAGQGQWEHGNYGIRVGPAFSGARFVEIFNTQDVAFGGWEGSGNKSREISEEGRRIHINLPKWSLLVFERQR